MIGSVVFMKAVSLVVFGDYCPADSPAESTRMKVWISRSPFDSEYDLLIGAMVTARSVPERRIMILKKFRS